MLIQEIVRPDSIIASQLVLVEFCNTIGQYRTHAPRSDSIVLRAAGDAAELKKRRFEAAIRPSFGEIIPSTQVQNAVSVYRQKQQVATTKVVARLLAFRKVTTESATAAGLRAAVQKRRETR